jgi:hypothetical protein
VHIHLLAALVTVALPYMTASLARDAPQAQPPSVHVSFRIASVFPPYETDAKGHDALIDLRAAPWIVFGGFE